MEQQGPGSAFRLPSLSDATILAFFDALRLSLNSGVAIAVTILGRTVALTGGVEQLKLRHPEFDWADSALIESMDLPLECGISVHFTRGANGVDMVRTLPEEADVPPIVLHYLRKEIQKMTGKPARPLIAAPSANDVSEDDVRTDRMARLKRLHMTVQAAPELVEATAVAELTAAAPRRSAPVLASPQPSRSVAARFGLTKPADATTRRLQDNITFALDTSAAKASDSWFKALISAEMIMILVFTIGLITIVVA